MLIRLLLFILLFIVTSCNSGSDLDQEIKDANIESGVTAESESNSFFPVTSFIRGQLAQIKNNGINPMKVTTGLNKNDTTWLQTENFNEHFDAFLHPVIDTANLLPFFTETKFEDQTLGTFTFMYTPSRPLPDSISLQNWAVYISPETNRVTRVYIVKTTGKNMQQLTWETDKYCKIVLIETGKDGKQYVAKEENIYWKFD